MREKILLTIQLIPLLIIGLCFENNLLAKEKESNLDVLIGSTFKSLAKVYIASADIEKIKTINIKKITRMDDGTYKKRYAEVYRVLKDLPSRILVKYGIKENMAKDEAINLIKGVNQNKLFEAVEVIPNGYIAAQFKQYFARKKRVLGVDTVEKQIKPFWGNIIKKAEKIKK